MTTNTTPRAIGHCSEDVAFRVICANQIPDHATIARFRARHERALSDLFSGVLSLCARAGLVKVGIVAIDGTKTAAAATHHATRDYEQIAQEILDEAGRIDRAEDELYGEARGDELPEGLRTSRPHGEPVLISRTASCRRCSSSGSCSRSPAPTASK